MLEFFYAIILGIIEGVTEFLPISSTGHLILANEFIKFQNQDFVKLFNIIVQLGAILAVVILFRKKLLPFGKDSTSEDRKYSFNLYKLAIIGVLPAIVLGALFNDIIDKIQENKVVIAMALMVGGIVILIIENRKQHTHKYTDITQLSIQTALFIGLFQCLAMVPGMSRSACTIIAAMLLGCSRVVAAEFSFFLAIPTMVAASGYSLLEYFKKSGDVGLHNVFLLMAGFITAFIVALLVVKAFMQFISRTNFKPFGTYRILLAIIVLLYFFAVK